ncbi:hypothetical protein EV426DRAFT_716476 [Tirmania nivea]|nr:hypothetical protein EV426DRAFT_716476 [Tirmania nivea]
MSCRRQCKGITQAGLQCKRILVSVPGSYCWQHTDQDVYVETYSYSSRKIGVDTIYSSYTRCKGKTVKGAQCRNTSANGGEYCWQHTYQSADYKSSDSESGTRRCRGQTLKDERCKRMLVHYPGHYCWQHTSQAPKEPAKPWSKKRTEEYLSSTSSYKPVSVPIPPIPLHPVRDSTPHTPTLETTLQVEEEPEQDTDVHTALISCQQADIHPSVPEIPVEDLSYSDSSESDIDEDDSRVGDLAEDSGFWEESPESANVSSDPTTCTVAALLGNEEEQSQGHDQLSSVGDLPDMLPQDLQANEPILLVDAPELEVPTHLPEKPTDNTSLQLTTWTVVGLNDEPEPTESVPEKPKKSKGSRSCSFGRIVNVLLSPFRSARSNEKLLTNEKKITSPVGEGLHSIGFSTETQHLLASLAQEALEYIYLATSLPNASGQLRIKLGRTNDPLEPSTDQACELTTVWKLPVANAARVEKLAHMAVKSEFDGGRSTIPFILSIESYGSGVQCPCTKTHQNILLTKSVGCDWLKGLVIGLDKKDRAERRRNSSGHELKVSLQVERPMVRNRALPESAIAVREEGAIAA